MSDNAHASTVTDLAVEPPPPGYNAAATLTFRLDPEPADPFAATGDADVRVILPEGRQALAFYDQDFAAINDGCFQRRVPIGRPYWRAYLPQWPANGVVAISSGGRRWTFKTDALAMRASTGNGGLLPNEQQTALPGATAERWRAPLEYTLPSDDTGWGFAPRYWTLTSGGAWKPASADAPPIAAKVWRPVLFWNSAWGNYGGAARPDIRVAQDMDAMLEKAAVRGDRRPLAVLDGEGFEREGTFNWDTHPLRGIVHGPGDIFSQDEGLDYCRRTMRYAVARWGLSNAVSDLLMTARLSHPAAALFHAKLASSVALWPIPQGASVRTLNPLACEPKVVAMLGSFKRDAPQTLGAWKADAMTSAADATVVDEHEQIQARDPRTTTLTLINTFSIEGPRMGAGAGQPQRRRYVAVRCLGSARSRTGLARRHSRARPRRHLVPDTAARNDPRLGDWTTYALDITGSRNRCTV